MFEVVVIFDNSGKFLGIAHEQGRLPNYAVRMRMEDYERLLQSVPREKRTIHDALLYGGEQIRAKETK